MVSYTWAFLDIDGTPNSTSHWHNKGCQRAWAWRHTLAWIGSGQMAEKLQPHSQENHWKGLWPSAVCRGTFYYAIAVKPGCRRTHSGTKELLSYTGVCAILSWRKFPNTVSQILQVAFSIENKWCGKTQISIRPQKLQHLDQYLMKPGHLDEICWKDNELF